MSCSERAGPREFRLAVAWRCRPQYAQGWRYIDILTAVVKLSSVLPLSVRRPTHCIYTSYGRFYYCKILRGHLGTIPYAASLRYSLKVSTGTVHGASSQNRQNGGLAISLVAGDSNAPFSAFCLLIGDMLFGCDTASFGGILANPVSSTPPSGTSC